LRRTVKIRAIVALDRMSFSTLMAVAAAVVLCFAGVFYFLSLHGSGLSQQADHLTFADSLYFSIVTFTSLGYGDIVPVGYGRLLACVEVVTGLGFLGVAIAKLSSAKQSYLIAQLYARDAQERLESYVLQMRDMKPAYKEAIELLKRGKWPTLALKRRHSDVHRLVLRIRAYLSFELNNGSFLRDVPSGAIAKVFNSLRQLAILVAESAAIIRSQHSQSQRMIAVNAIREMRSLVTLVPVQDCDLAIQSSVLRLSDCCERFERELVDLLHSVAEATSSRLPTKFQ
jgi:hypothetical protein